MKCESESVHHALVIIALDLGCRLMTSGEVYERDLINELHEDGPYDTRPTREKR